MSWYYSRSLFKAEDGLSSTSNGKLETCSVKTCRLAGKNFTFHCCYSSCLSWRLYRSCPQRFFISEAETVLWCPALKQILLILVESGLYCGPWLSCPVYPKMHRFSGETYFTLLVPRPASHTPDLSFHPFANIFLQNFSMFRGIQPETLQFQKPQASPSVPCPPLLLPCNRETIDKLVETESTPACVGTGREMGLSAPCPGPSQGRIPLVPENSSEDNAFPCLLLSVSTHKLSHHALWV